MAIHESIETILLKRNRKAWRKDFGPKKFDSMLSESETEDKQRALRSGSYKPGDEAPKVSTQSDTVRPWDVAQTEKTFYTGSQNSGIMGQNDNSDPYAIQEPRQKPYTNPYDIPQGYNQNDYVYKNVAPKVNADPYAKTWTDEQKTRKRLQDAMINRNNLENSFVGMPTTEVVLQLGEYDDTIKKLSQELGVGDSVANAPLGQGFVADVVDREQEIADQSTKPSVPTTTEPADDEQPEFELYEPVEPQLTLEEQIQQNALDKPFGQLGALTPDWEKPQDGSGNAGGGYVNLYDDIPTMEDIEAAKAEQAANGSNGVGADASDEYYIKPSNFTDEDYGRELIKQLYLNNVDGNVDAFLTQNGYEAGEEGKKALLDEAEDRMGIESVVAYWGNLNEMYGGDPLQNGITAPPSESGVEGGETESPVVPVAGGLYYNTETGEYVDNYNYAGNDIDEKYPAEPSPGPMPGPPPVPEDHPDMENYEEEVGQYWDDYDAWHEANMIQEANDIKDILEEREDEGKPTYEAINETDATIDKETINNIVTVGYNSNGALSDDFQKQYEEGNIQIRINDFNEYEKNEDEALALFYEEQEHRNELVSTIIGIIGTKGKLVESVILLANMLLDGNNVTNAAMEYAILGLKIGDVAKGLLFDYAIELGTETFLNAVDSMHYNARNIEGGNYIEVEIFHEPKDETGLPILIQNLRLFEVDGVYIYDELNPLCQVIPETW